MTTTPTRGRYRKPRNHRKLAVVAALAAVLLILVGACSDTTAELDSEPVAEESEPTPDPVAEAEKAYEEALEAAEKLAEETEPEPEPEDLTAEIGDMATITQDWDDGATEGTVTVSAVEVKTRPHDEYGDAPKHGVFVIFTVDVTADEAAFDVYEGDFYIRAEDGTRYETGDGNSFDATDYDDQLGWVELNAGEKRSGLLVFDVPEPAGVLAYAPNYDGGPIVEWTFDEDAS